MKLIREGCNNSICFFPWCKTNPFRLTFFNELTPELEWEVTKSVLNPKLKIPPKCIEPSVKNSDPLTSAQIRNIKKLGFTLV
mmetsp:Transcript_13582/g.21212  ORF Transcript_13582/g.21212 Transcript_13582/m.21212 type:complete len:82 (-) Transcript_13582:2071-2316(-)